MTAVHGKARLFTRGLAVACLIMGLAILSLSIRESSKYPDRSELTRVDGVVRWTKTDRYGVEFGMQGSQRTFVYLNRSGERHSIQAALVDAPHPSLSLWISPKRIQQRPNGGPYFDVYAIDAPAHMKRSYEQIRQSWRHDYWIAYGLASLFLIAAVAIEVRSRTKEV